MTDAIILEVSTVAIQMIEALGDRRFEPFRRNEAADLRRRFLTLAVRAYSEVQRGVCLWRWHHGDYEQKSPSLFKRGPRRKKEDGGSAESANQAEEGSGISVGGDHQAAPAVAGNVNAESPGFG